MITVLQRDCVTYLKETEKRFPLIIADPPYNIGESYETYIDKQSQPDFVRFTTEWVGHCWERCSGVMCLIGPDSLAKFFIALEYPMGLHAIDWIVWHFTFGQTTTKKFVKSKIHILVYSKVSKPTWNAEAVGVPTWRHLNGDSRSAKSWKVPDDVWDIPRVVGNSPERRAFSPNQLPLELVSRLVRAYSNLGDTVFDPFCGSGTTAIACKQLQRACVTTDICPNVVKEVRNIV
jgi:site-specific DNA-methyltransferase (adenine-specific)